MASRLLSSLFIKAIQVMQDTDHCYDCAIGGNM